MSALTQSERAAVATPPRSHLFAALVLLAAGNAVTARALMSVHDMGLGAALLDGLGASWGFWLALGLTIRLALASSPSPASRKELILAGLAVLVIASPFRQASSLVATAIAGWLILRRDIDPRLRAAAIVLLAMSVNLLWSHVLMLVAAGPIEGFDAFMVGRIIGVPTEANVIHFVGSDDRFVVMTACTSVQSASVALLLWLAIARSARPGPRPRDLLIGLGLFATVVAVNLVRLSLMAQDRATFRYIHDGPGGALFNLIITVAALAWAVADVRKELFR